MKSYYLGNKATKTLTFFLLCWKLITDASCYFRNGEKKTNE